MGADIVACIDISGSMQGSKIDSVKDTLKYIISQLGSRDRLCLITFNHQATRLTRFHLCSTAGEGHRLLMHSVEAVKASGGTAINTAFSLALDVLETRTEKNDTAAVLLLSDGQDNVTFDYRYLLARASKAGVPFFTFGFGADHDSALLSKLACGAGTFTYVAASSDFEEAFAGCIGGVKSTVYRDFQVNVNAILAADGLQVAVAKVNSTYPYFVEGSTAKIEFGDLFSEEKREFVVEFLIKIDENAGKSATTASEIKIASVQGAYTDVLCGSAATFSSPHLLTLPLITEVPANVLPNALVVREELRFLTVNAMEAAVLSAEAGNYAGSTEGLQVSLAIFSRTVSDAYNVEFLDFMRLDVVRPRQIPEAEWAFVWALVLDIRDCQQRCASKATLERGSAAEYSKFDAYKKQRVTYSSNTIGMSSNMQMLWNVQSARSSAMQSISKARK
ncbi:hypothetical protein HDU82_001417 [Entophlyctis luteolus]|nr:hypothetical protein HDU82_001417 [Entophlyctis luteolus]